jgi:hypothetical protein
MREDRQAQSLATVVQSAGFRCKSGTRAFFQGFEGPGRSASWNVTCGDGRSYSITIHNDATGSTKVLGCDVIERATKVRCFQKY